MKKNVKSCALGGISRIPNPKRKHSNIHHSSRERHGRTSFQVPSQSQPLADRSRLIKNESESLERDPTQPCLPPLTQTLNLTFLYATVSTLKPTVGMVVTEWPSFSLYKMVVLPAASSPSIKILISLLPKILLSNFPILPAPEKIGRVEFSHCSCYQGNVEGKSYVSITFSDHFIKVNEPELFMIEDTLWMRNNGTNLECRQVQTAPNFSSFMLSC